MDKDIAISVQNVNMEFNLQKEKVDNLKEYVIKLITGKLEHKKFHALEDINFEVKKGDHLAVLGLNGAGKSTLLKAIVGVYKPTSGSIEVNGVVAPLLELGAGFSTDYTGKENIFLYGAILGYEKEYLVEKYDEIVEFSELGNFINVPLKNYSSGMKARLGFSIATAVEPDILILDEVLSVGDAAFKEKSLAKIQSMFECNVTVLFVSHNITQVKKICNKAILLEHGKIIASGDVDEVAKIYEEKTEKKGKKEKKEKKKVSKSAKKSLEKQDSTVQQPLQTEPVQAKSSVEKLLKAKALYQAGIISDDDFSIIKEKYLNLINGSPAFQDPDKKTVNNPEKKAGIVSRLKNAKKDFDSDRMSRADFEQVRSEYLAYVLKGGDESALSEEEISVIKEIVQ